jgi:hypothetical protein
MTHAQQITKAARIGTGFVRLAGSSPGDGTALAKQAAHWADKLIGLSDDNRLTRELQVRAFKCGQTILEMLQSRFGNKWI